MIKSFFVFTFFQPLYNILVFLADILPGHDVGLAIVLLTILVRLALFPLYHKSTKTQAKLKEIEPELKALKEEHKDREAQAKAMMELYKNHGINPLSGFMLLLIQLPVIFSLYYVFKDSINSHLDLVYSFINFPEVTSNLFLGVIDISSKSLVLAIVVGATQFIQMQLALPPLPPKKEGAEKSFSDDMSRSMQMQMKYFLPIVIIFIARSLPIALSLYWITSNLFSIGHELIVKKKALDLFGKIKRPQS